MVVMVLIIVPIPPFPTNRTKGKFGVQLLEVRLLDVLGLQRSTMLLPCKEIPV